MRPGAEGRRRTLKRLGGVAALAGAAALSAGAVAAAGAAAPACQPVYLTFDTGHMGVAPLVAAVLQRQAVRVTFFAAHERTQQGDGTLGEHWAGWWKARAAEGHAFASHTYQHAYWQADLPPARPGEAGRFRIRPSSGPQAGQSMTWRAGQYCEDLDRARDRLAQLTGHKPLPLFRAPGGKTSSRLLQAAAACGYQHVGWAPAGFLGDELPSDKYPNDALLRRALATIRPGDVLMAHLGIWSRQDPWAPAVLEPLIEGLKARGFCFKTLREHPDHQAWLVAHGGADAMSRTQRHHRAPAKQCRHAQACAGTGGLWCARAAATGSPWTP